MTKRSSIRHAIVLALSSLTLSSGCASMSGPSSWFSRSESTGASSGIASSLSGAGRGISGQVKTMGTAVSSAMGKAKNAVISPFAADTNNSDPTSLSNMPTNLGPEVWVTNGQLFETKGNYAKALDNYTKALEAEPNNEAALLSIARLYDRQQQFPRAEEFYSKALAVKPAAGTYNELAMVQQKQGRTAEAQAAIQKAIALEPNSLRYHNNLAGLLVSAGRSDEAVKQLEKVFPPAVANYNVARLHFTNQNMAGAQQHLQLALQADPNLKEARELMNTIAGSPTAQSAVAAYGTANQLYRTAQAIASPTVQAEAAIYQPQASPVQSNQAAPTYTN